MKINKNAARKAFYHYVTDCRKLFRTSLWDQDDGLYCLLSPNDNPNLKHFTQFINCPGYAVIVRLSYKDLFNDAITGGYFDQYPEIIKR